jgi:hypothetical protein
LPGDLAGDEFLEVKVLRVVPIPNPSRTPEVRIPDSVLRPAPVKTTDPLAFKSILDSSISLHRPPSLSPLSNNFELK